MQQAAPLVLGQVLPGGVCTASYNDGDGIAFTLANSEPHEHPTDQACLAETLLERTTLVA
jgi:hypothetical protein